MQRAMLDNAAILGVEGRVASLTSVRRRARSAVRRRRRRRARRARIDRPRRRSLAVPHPTSCARSPTARSPSRPARSAMPATARHLAQLGDLLLDQRAHHLACAAELVAEIGPTPGVPRDAAAQAATLLRAGGRRLVSAGRPPPRAAGDRAGAGARPRRRHAAGGAAADGRGAGRDAGAATGPRRVGGGARAGRQRPAIVSPTPRRCGCAARRRRWRATSSPPARDLGQAVGELREIGDQVHLGEALRARGFAEVFGGSLGDAEWFLGEADRRLRRGRRPARPGLGAAAPGVGVVPRRRPCRVAAPRLTSAIESFEQLGDRSGVTWARGLLAYVHHFGRRNAEAEALAERRARGGASLGRRVGRGDDAQPAGQHPAVVGRRRQGPHARRQGAGRLPPHRRPVRDHPGAGHAQPGAGRVRPHAPTPNAASRRSWCSPTPSARWPTR